ncbi:expressed unknown protein [Seminavis robusta]|uniref:TFIIH p62 subunit N-terminal domain-containing protein n=1 Tax=Seminavis robusta TaxID=568900 RepID=A0A9N8EDM7_9STRA|nr:expressed unknown protein [Seminavis robusta]|eukprot:Sro794_g203340.1 n/a (196) ;mRNA; f:8812-9399
MVAQTTYKPVTYVTKGGGTLKLYDKELTFQMKDASAANGIKIFTLPWSKIKKRQVSDSGTTGKPKIKLILKSGTEAIFQMDDRISLEVLRDDIAERLARWKEKYPDSDDEAVNQTRGAGTTQRRQSTPYRMAKPVVETTRASMSQPRASQPYRMAAPQKLPATAPRQSQPYRMKKQNEPEPPRQSQPYRFVAAKK